MREALIVVVLSACGSVPATTDGGGDDGSGAMLTVMRSGNGAGKVTGDGIDCGTDCMQSYPEGTAVTLHATADPGSAFGGWSGDGVACPNGDCMLTIAANITVTAEFVIDECVANTTTCDAPTNKLTVCDGSGHIASTTTCLLGCATSGDRCTDVDPSNGLAPHLDMTGTAPLVDRPDATIIDTTTGTVTGPGGAITVPSMVVAQTNAPSIRVFIVKSATLNDVQISGTHAFALVSDGLITIQGRVT